MSSLIQILGALLVLAAFALAQARTLHVRANVPRCRYGYYISPLIAGSNDRLAWTFVGTSNPRTSVVHVPGRQIHMKGKDMEFQQVIDRALRIRQHYAAYEQRLYGRSWTTEELFIGMVGDMGDLAKLIQAHEGVRAIEESESQLRRELADVLWSVIVLADRCGVDLVAAFDEDMSSLETALIAHESGQEG